MSACARVFVCIRVLVFVYVCFDGSEYHYLGTGFNISTLWRTTPGPRLNSHRSLGQCHRIVVHTTSYLYVWCSYRYH